MSQKTAFVVLTGVLVAVLGAVMDFAYRINVSEHWDAHRCDPYVVATAGFFKPRNDPRTAVEFARDNWSFCQKKYVQSAIRDAAEVPEKLATAQADIAGLASELVGVLADTFFDLWKMCYEAYSSFMGTMKTTAKLFQNFMINMKDLVGRVHGAAISIVYGLITTVVAFLNATQLTIIVAIVIIGILLILQIILFFVLLPISGLIITATAIVSVAVVAVGTAVAAAMVGGMGACFAAGTAVYMSDGSTRPIEEVHIGDELFGGGIVSATHMFLNDGTGLYELGGVIVSGDHLVDGLTPVSRHPEARPYRRGLWDWLSDNHRVWCLTTTNRRIPVRGSSGQLLMFADWEEIPEDDTASQLAWYCSVWAHLNGGSPPTLVRTPRGYQQEAGLAPDVMVSAQRWDGCRVWKRVSDIQIGERIFSGGVPTMVVGRVESMGDLRGDVVALVSPEHGPQLVSGGTWIRQDSGIWSQAAELTGGAHSDCHVGRWIHLYTESGVVELSGGWQVRDASDVGLGVIGELVEEVVLGVDVNSRMDVE